jgi:predicted RNA-binding protein YlqC (UPF0109 family)
VEKTAVDKKKFSKGAKSVDLVVKRVERFIQSALTLLAEGEGEVSSSTHEDLLYVKIKVPAGRKGSVIGGQGKNIENIRSIANAGTKRFGIRTFVELD